jgi:ribosomal protein L10
VNKKSESSQSRVGSFKERVTSLKKKKTKKMVSLKKQALSEKCRRFFKQAPILLFYHANSLTIKETREGRESLFSLFSQKKIESLFLKRRVASVVFSEILTPTQQIKGPALDQLFQGPTLCFALSDEAEMRQIHHSLLKIPRNPPLLLGSLYRGNLYNALETSHLLSLDESLSLHLLRSLSFPVSRLFWSFKEAQGRQSQLLASLPTRLLLTLRMLQKQAASGDSANP